MRNRTALVLSLAGAITVPMLAVTPSLAGPGSTPNFGVMWTVDSANNSLSEYAPNAGDAASPIATISGGDTGLHAPSAVAIDDTGNVFVANAGNDSITEYDPGATDDAAPIATISGPKTGLDGPSSISLSNDELWVTDPDSNLVEAFSAGESGDVLPAETIAGPKTRLHHPVGVAVTGDAELGFTAVTVIDHPATGKAGMVSFGSGRGNVKPDDTLLGTANLTSPTAIMAADEQDVWVSDGASNSLTDYFVLPGFVNFGGAGAGIEKAARIKGAATGLNAPGGLGHDALGHLVVSNGGDHSVLLFANGANGNVAPVRTVTGVGSGAGEPAAAQVFGAAPGAPTDVKVKIKGTTAHVSWKPPAITGGGVIGYDVIKIRTFGDGSSGGSFGLVSFTGGGIDVMTKRPHFTARHIKAGVKYEFLVTSVNAFGGTFAHPVAAAKVTVPGAPRKVHALVSKHSMLVRWRRPEIDGGTRLTHYIVQYAAGCRPGVKGCHVKRQKVHGFQTSVTIAGLKANTTYQARVIATNSLGQGKPSKVVAVTTSK